MNDKIELFFENNPITIKGKHGGVSIEEITKYLSLNGKSAFLQVIKSLIDEPNNLRRNAKYAGALDQLDDSTAGMFDVKRSWREPWNNYVILENSPDEAIDELTRIYLHISKPGRGGYSAQGWLFSGREHMTLESGKTLDALNWVACIRPDGKIDLMSPEDQEKMSDVLMQELEEET